MMPPVQRHSWVGSLKYPHGHPCRYQLNLSMNHEGRLVARGDWVPVVDAFRTLVACPPPDIRAALQQVHGLTVACA